MARVPQKRPTEHASQVLTVKAGFPEVMAATAGQGGQVVKAAQAEQPVTLICLFRTETSTYIVLSQMAGLEGLAERQVMVARGAMGEKGVMVETVLLARVM